MGALTGYGCRYSGASRPSQSEQQRLSALSLVLVVLAVSSQFLVVEPLAQRLLDIGGHRLFCRHRQVRGS
jgi:hypothetical protein